MAQSDDIPRTEKYLEDLATIRSILSRNEEKAMTEPWAFFTWSGVVIAATALHIFLQPYFRSSQTSPLLMIWVPALITGAVLESIAWLREMNKQSTPLFGKRFVRFSLSLLGAMTAMIVVSIDLYLRGDLSPAILFLLLSIMFFMYAQSSFSALYIEAFVLFIIGIVFLAGGMTSDAAYIFTGFFTGIYFAIMGVHVVSLERKSRG